MRNRSFFLAIALTLLISANVFAQRTISVDASRIKGARNEAWNECIGAGRAEEGLRADWQQQLTLIQQTMHFKYIRFHGLLNDEMHIYTEDTDGKPVYNWQYLDKLYDFLLSVHIKPFVELGFMPPALASGTKTVFWWKGNVTPPKSYEQWAAFIEALVTHLKERYGHNEVKTWYFEIWNEPDLGGFWAGTQDEYFKLYQYTANAVKKVSPEYRVGGPATARSKWIKPFLKYCADNKAPLDFVSTHSYNTKSVFDEFGKSKRKLFPFNYLYSNVNYVRRVVDSTFFKGMPLHYTEFNSSPSSHDPLHDAYQNAPFILSTLRHTENVAASMSYWTFTDIFEEAGPALTPFHGGFGLLNLQEIKKPTFFAYKYLGQLGNRELPNTDTASIVTKSDNGYQVLAWDLTFPKADSVLDEVYFKDLRPASAKGRLTVDLQHVANGRYQLMVFKTGYLHNDPLSAYINMGRPFYITPAQVKMLQALTEDKPLVKKSVTINNGNYTETLSMNENDIFLIKLVRMK